MSDDPKSVEYYAATVNAWLNTKFEHDKSLLTLSAGGVGLLITLLSTSGIGSIESLVLYILALFAFVVCLGTLLWIFRRNAKHLEGVVKGTEKNDNVLIILDNIAISSFLLGVVFAATIGISTAVNSYHEKERKMAEEKSHKATGRQIAYDSVNGVSNLAPDNIAKLSVEGISHLNPSNVAAPQSSLPPPAPAASSPNNAEPKK